MSVNPVTTPFTAAWPKELQPTSAALYLKGAWNVASVILFPIGLTRLAYYQLQRLAAQVIHPIAEERKFYSNDHLLAMGGREVTIGTPDGEKINAMLFSATGKCRGAIIRTFGNNATYENSGESFVQFVRKYVGNDVDVLLLNTRGCGKSTGVTSPQGMALDVYSAGEYLLKKRKVVPLFTGHSLGGYSSVKGAGLFQRQHPDEKVSALNERSFSSLMETANEIFGALGGWLIWLLDWELDARPEWDALQGRKICVFHSYDWLPKQFVQHARTSPNTQILEMSPLPFESPQLAHCRDYTPEEARKIGTALSSVLT